MIGFICLDSRSQRYKNWNVCLVFFATNSPFKGSPIKSRVSSFFNLFFLTVLCLWVLFLRLEEALLFSVFMTRRRVLEKSFFNHFLTKCWSRSWKAWKILEWFGCWTKLNSGAKKRVRFLFILLFSRERKIEMWKKFCKRANFSVHLQLFKTVFIYFFCLIILVMIVSCFTVILIMIWIILVIHMNFIPICTFFSYFTEF